MLEYIRLLKSKFWIYMLHEILLVFFFFQIKKYYMYQLERDKKMRNTYSFQGLNCIIFLKLRKVYHKYHYAVNCLYFFSTWMVIMRWSFRHSIVILQRRKLYKTLIDFSILERTWLSFLTDILSKWLSKRWKVPFYPAFIFRNLHMFYTPNMIKSIVRTDHLTR